MPTTEWILDSRPKLARPIPGGALLGQQDEWEARSAMDHSPVRVRTLFLRGAECRFHCTMCDLWQYTHVQSTRVGDIPEQLRQGLSDVASTEPQPTWLKLYNASSFFDNRNVPTEDLPNVASQVRLMQRVIVENHPRLLSSAALDSFRSQIAPAQLEVAMGLETVHVEVLRKLNKQMTVDDFQSAIDLCRRSSVDTRAFVLLQTPWLDHEAALHWCQATIDAARSMGVRHISVIPVRSGNGAMERLIKSGEFTPPTALMLEKILTENISDQASLVTVDLWDWDKLRGTCPNCSASRRTRLAAMNVNRQPLPAIECEHCDVS